MEARIDLAAAASLVLAMALATIGTVWNLEPSRTPCGASCQTDAARRTAVAPDDWEASLHRFVWRVEQGFQQMAGRPHGR